MMGLDASTLRLPHVARLLDKATRKAEGVSTPAEQREKSAAKDEREIHGLIYSWLNLEGLYFEHENTGKRHTGRKGMPDFRLPYRSKRGQTFFVAWEVKPSWRQQLRPEQAEARDKIIAQGGAWRLVTSLVDAQNHLRELDTKAGQI